MSSEIETGELFMCQNVQIKVSLKHIGENALVSKESGLDTHTPVS